MVFRVWRSPDQIRRGDQAGAQDQGFGDDLMALAFQFQRAAVGVATGIAAAALACLPAQPTLDRLARDVMGRKSSELDPDERDVLSRVLTGT